MGESFLPEDQRSAIENNSIMKAQKQVELQRQEILKMAYFNPSEIYLEYEPKPLTSEFISAPQKDDQDQVIDLEKVRRIMAVPM